MIYTLSHVGMLLNGELGFHFSFQAVHAAVLGSRSHCQREPVKDSYIKIKATKCMIIRLCPLPPHMELCNTPDPVRPAAGG